MRVTKLLLMTFSLVALLAVATEAFCLGLLCGVAPLVAKGCCRVKRRCCVQYQAWLAPLIGTNDILAEYVEAVAHEVFHDPAREDRLDGSETD